MKSQSFPPKAGALSTTLSHEQMHAVHRCLRNENALWHEELKLWQDELKRSDENLAKVRAALEMHAKKLEKHGASLTLYAQESLAHEHALAEYQRGGSGQKLAELAQAHRTEIEHHDHVRGLHEQFKRLHHTIVARCSLLLKAISDEGSCAK